MAMGVVRAEMMPSSLLPQFPHAEVSTAGEQPLQRSYVSGVGCKVLAELEGGIMMDGEKEKEKEEVAQDMKLTGVSDLPEASS